MRHLFVQIAVDVKVTDIVMIMENVKEQVVVQNHAVFLSAFRLVVAK